jgi:hypothetical protein
VIGPDHLHILSDGHRAHPHVYRRDESVLLESAGTLDPSQLRKAVDYWRSAADPDDSDRLAEVRYHRRWLHVSETLDGMIRIDGMLDPEGGQIVLAATRSLAEPAGLDRSDGRTPAQRRADAMVDICRDHLDHGDAPVQGGVKPHLSVIVDLRALTGRSGFRGETEDGTPLALETLRRLACDAAVCRVLTDGPSQPLDVGRATRTVSPSQRIALIVRDGGCAWPGCDRPPRWCDVHHLEHWADGGTTDLDNLCLLCRRHHRMVHEGGATTTFLRLRSDFTRDSESTRHDGDNHRPGGADGSRAPP